MTTTTATNTTATNTTAIATTGARRAPWAAAALRRLLAPLLALMLLVGAAAPATARAATPTATNYGSPSVTVFRGTGRDFRFYLRSNSYGYRHGYRARFNTDMFKSSNGRHVAGTSYKYFGGPQGFKVHYSFRWSSYSPFSSYKLRYRTQYRSSAYSGCWRTATSRYIRVYVV